MKIRPIEWVIVSAILLLVACFFAPQGSLHYFSPDSLESTYRLEGLLFWTQIPLYHSGLRDKPVTLVDYLIGKGHWTKANSNRRRWITTAHFNKQWHDGQLPLHRELYWHGEKWIDWSEANPELAKVVWPRLLAALRDNRTEHFAVELLYLAENAKTVGEFEEQARTTEMQWREYYESQRPARD